ncbi:MAG: PAS domain S-box protein, partial [bacterium]
QSRQIWGDIKFVGPEGYHLYKARFVETGMEVKADQWAAPIALQTGKPVLNQELEIESFDGKKKFILNSAIPITDSFGEITGAVVINYDITELKIAYQMISESERQYRQLVDNAPFVIYCLNREGKITQLNPAFERILGWKRDDWLGKEFTPLVHPEDLTLAQELLGRIFNGETPPLYHLRIRCKDGSYRIGQFTAMPVIEEGQVVAKFGIAQDITELMNLYQIAATSEEFFQKLVNSIPQGVALLDEELKIRFLNHSAVQILEAPHPQSLIGMSVLSFIHPDYVPLAIERTQMVLTQRESALPVMTKWKTFTGKYKDIETTSIPYTFSDGSKGILVIFSDMTPLRSSLQQKEY